MSLKTPRCKEGGTSFEGGHMGSMLACQHCGLGLREHVVKMAMKDGKAEVIDGFEVQATLPYLPDGTPPEAGPYCPDGSGRAYQGGDEDVCQQCGLPIGRHVTFQVDKEDGTEAIVPLDNIPRGIKLDAWMRFAEGFTKGYLAAGNPFLDDYVLSQVAADYADKLLAQMLKREWT